MGKRITGETVRQERRRMSRIVKLAGSIQRLNRQLCNGIESVGVIALLLIMSVTVMDVIGAKVFLAPVPGAMDVVTLFQTVAISMCAAATLVAGRHVRVDVFIVNLPTGMHRFAVCLGNLISFFLCALIVWRLSVYGQELRLDGEVSPTARFPLYPFAWGIAFGMVPACIDLFTRTVLIASHGDAGTEVS